MFEYAGIVFIHLLTAIFIVSFVEMFTRLMKSNTLATTADIVVFFGTLVLVSMVASYWLSVLL